MDHRPPILDSDQRRTPRLSMTWRARLLLDSGVMESVRTFDLSMGGVGVLCDKPLPLHVPLRVALEVPSGGGKPPRVVVADAKAVFQILSGGHYRIGLQWSVADSELLSVLSPWLERLMTI